MQTPTGFKFEGSGQWICMCSWEVVTHQQNTTKLTFITRYTQEAPAKSVWDCHTWITLSPGSSPECNVGLALWGTEYTQLSLHLVKAEGTKHLARSHPGNRSHYIKSKKADLSPGKDIPCKLWMHLYRRLPVAPSCDAVQMLSDFHPPSHMKFCIKTTFSLCFTSAFLLPIKNHGCIGWLRKDDIPRQEFLLCFQAPAFAFSREHFDWLHSPSGHSKGPQGSGGGYLRASPISCHSCQLRLAARPGL